jgi:hypothetical protein
VSHIQPTSGTAYSGSTATESLPERPAVHTMLALEYCPAAGSTRQAGRQGWAAPLIAAIL